MAIDTQHKRSSCIGWGLAPPRTGFVPDGSNLDGVDERQHASYAYAGLDAAASTTIDAIGTTDGGPSALTPGYIDFGGGHWLDNAPEIERFFFRLDNVGNAEIGDGETGDLRIEWRTRGGLIGGRFGIHIGSSNPSMTPNYLGEIEFKQRGNARRLDFTLPRLGKGPVQYNRLSVPNAVMAEHDGHDFFYIYFQPRDHSELVIVTGLQLTFDT